MKIYSYFWILLNNCKNGLNHQMKFFIPLFILAGLSSGSVNARGGYRSLPPPENRASRQMYWQKDRSHSSLKVNQYFVLAHNKTALSEAN